MNKEKHAFKLYTDILGKHLVHSCLDGYDVLL